VNQFAQFNSFVNRPKARRESRLYSLPFNMNTFHEIWPDVITPADAQRKIQEQRLHLDSPARNLEEQALSMVGTDIYQLLIRDYTRKQWGRDPRELPADIIKRLPLRWTYDDNYFNDRYQGIPEDGYTAMFDRMLEGIDCILGVDYFLDRDYWNQQARRVVFTGKIDQWFDYDLGELEYRTLEFDTWIEQTNNYQGTAVINYCDDHIPWTRMIEHRHFKTCHSDHTVITKEIPVPWKNGAIPYYPVNDVANQELYDRYRQRSQNQGVIFGGRLAEYRYYDMHQVIASAMKTARQELS
jgi:UDP-galactopyranose mutase